MSKGAKKSRLQGVFSSRRASQNVPVSASVAPDDAHINSGVSAETFDVVSQTPVISVDKQVARKLTRVELLEILVDQGRYIEKLTKELEATKKELAAREIKIQNAGSLAEASLALSGVFEAAEAAARSYVENIHQDTLEIPLVPHAEAPPAQAPPAQASSANTKENQRSIDTNEVSSADTNNTFAANIENASVDTNEVAVSRAKKKKKGKSS